MRWIGLVAALCACGDNLLPDGEQLAARSDLVIVAHQDDDLFFMQPDLVELVRSGSGVTTVYVTAGNNAHGPSAADPRYEGLRHAYGAAAGSNDWRCGWLTIAGHVAEHCRLADRPVSLVFLGYPDGGLHGEFANSLLKLWEGAVVRAETVADRTTSYTRTELIETVAEIIQETHPATVHTLEVAATHGNDHSDHMIVGALALLALARTPSHADVVSYRAYSILTEAVNKVPSLLAAAFTMLARYEACTAKCAACGDACTQVADSHIAWLSRRYAVGFRPAAAGQVRAGDGRCLAADLTLATCDSAPAWRLDRDRKLHGESQCLSIEPTGAVAWSDCTIASRFFFDDEGHLWSGVPPTPQANMDFAHLWCLAPTDAGIQAQLCGRDAAPVWELAPRTVTTPRPFATAMQLGDVNDDGKADLCTIANGSLTCALGDGTGGFSAPIAITALAVDPTSLALGDLDGDHLTDACGRDAGGVLCAMAATGPVTRYSSAFAGTGPLAIVDGELCGATAAGLACGAQPRVLAAAGWPVELDGDGSVDWCVATDGLACGIAADHADAGSWSFSQAGVIDADLDPVFADIDGDGRADACAVDGGRVRCARSQGHGFGPRTTLAIVPEPVTGLWLGDLDGDGRADACAATGTAIVCAVEPQK